MSVLELIGGSVGVLRKNKCMLILPLAKYFSYIVIVLFYFFVWFALSVLSFLLDDFALLITSAVMSLVLCLLSVIGCGAFFTAATSRYASDALDGKIVSSSNVLGWGLRRWLSVFTADVLLYGSFILVLFLFAPSVFLAVRGQYNVALSFGLGAAALVLGYYVVAGVLLMPLNYVVSLGEVRFSRCFKWTASFVWANLPQSLMIAFVATAATATLICIPTVVTGPVGKLASVFFYLGSGLSAVEEGLGTPFIIFYLVIYSFAITATTIFSIIISAVVEAAQTIWWVKLIKDGRQNQIL